VNDYTNPTHYAWQAGKSLNAHMKLHAEVSFSFKLAASPASATRNP